MSKKNSQPLKSNDFAALLAQLEAARAENAALRSRPFHSLSFKVSEKGALSVYGLGRFPVTLYKEQWQRLLGAAQSIQDFINANAHALSVKPPVATLISTQNGEAAK